MFGYLSLVTVCYLVLDVYTGTLEKLTRVIALRQAADEVVSVGLFGRCDHDFSRSVRETVGDVLLYRASKKDWLLSNQHHLREESISYILLVMHFKIMRIFDLLKLHI